MSMKKWRKLAEEKAKLNEQTKEIHQKFKMDKINKEFGQLSGEEFFKPIHAGPGEGTKLHARKTFASFIR